MELCIIGGLEFDRSAHHCVSVQQLLQPSCADVASIGAAETHSAKPSSSNEFTRGPQSPPGALRSTTSVLCSNSSIATVRGSIKCDPMIV